MARLVCALILVGLVPLTAGYPTGAPTNACQTMIPQHGYTFPLEGPSPFGIKLIQAPALISPGQQIILRVHNINNTGELFKGFFVRAFEGNAPSHGQFVNGPNIFQCNYPSDSATHASPFDKVMVDLTWQVPNYYYSNTIVTFKSTVVENYSKIHINKDFTIQVQAIRH